MKMISIDPGTLTCGVAVWDIDNLTFNITNVHTFTITIKPDIELEFRLYELYRVLNTIINEVQPIHYIHESAFMNRFRPQAYGPIYAAIFMIRKAFIDFNGPNGIFAYAPKSIKMVISTGTADKNDMFEAVKKINEINSFLTGYEDEHQIDALAIGYTHLLSIRYNPEILLL